MGNIAWLLFCKGVPRQYMEEEVYMIKKRRILPSLIIAIILILSSSTSAFAVFSYEPKFNNTITANSVASISDGGLLTITNKYQPKVKLQHILRRKRWDSSGRELILDNLTTNGMMLYTTTCISVIIRSNWLLTAPTELQSSM